MINAQLIDINTKRITDIDKSVMRIGREKNYVDCHIDSDTVSRSHCIISFDNDSFFIEDTNSLNHTFVNGRKLAPAEKYELSDKDIISIADRRFMFLTVKEKEVD